MLGNGDGTFQDARRLRDRRIRHDVGRGRRLQRRRPSGCRRRQPLGSGRGQRTGLMLSDSVMILPGDGTGRLLAPTGFVFGYGCTGVRRSSTTTRRITAHHERLNTSDLNGDGRTDLIGSPGAILLNRPAAPESSAGRVCGSRLHGVRTTTRTSSSAARAQDPDNHWVTYTWRDDSRHHHQQASRRARRLRIAARPAPTRSP